MIQGLSKRLQISRINCNFSRKQAAQRIGVSESMVGLYETGARQPSLEALVKLSSLYHVTSDYLLGIDSPGRDALSLDGLSDSQIRALTLTAQCFKRQGV